MSRPHRDGFINQEKAICAVFVQAVRTTKSNKNLHANADEMMEANYSTRKHHKSDSYSNENAEYVRRALVAKSWISEQMKKQIEGPK